VEANVLQILSAAQKAALFSLPEKLKIAATKNVTSVTSLNNSVTL